MFDRTHIDDDRTHAREKANKEGAHMKKPSYKQNLPMQYVSRVEAVSLCYCRLLIEHILDELIQT
jgi:hypothetical protein